MSTDFNAGVTDLKTNEAKLLDQRGRVARFCYEEQALEGNSDTDVFGVNAYNYNNTQNVPMGTSAVLQMSESVLSKGLRSQGSSFTRMGVNHFWGRVSYNVNKLAKHMSDLISYFKDFLRESGNAWSPTAIYLTGDTVYCMVTLGGAPYKRIFLCLQSNTDVSPVDENGNAINPSYWQEIGGNFASDINVRGNGRFQNDVQVEKNLNVRGDLIVEGSTIITDEQTVSTESDYVVLRKNNPSALGSTEKAGMVIHNYDTNKNAFIGVDKDGIFRVSDNASENTTVYNNVSRFGSDYFEGLTQAPATVVSGAVTAEDADELEDCVLNNSSYYHNLNAQWFLVSLSSNALYFDNTSPVTDASLIAVLEASVKKTLFYFRSLSVLVVSDTQNQPLMTRAEASTFTDEHLLMWDALNNKAKDSGISKSDIQSLITNIFLTAHPVGSLFWTNDPTDPSITYGGTWVRIKDTFVYAMGDNDTVNATGGVRTNTLTVNNIPSHTHTLDHTHKYTPSGYVASSSNGKDNKVVGSLGTVRLSLTDPAGSGAYPQIGFSSNNNNIVEVASVNRNQGTYLNQYTFNGLNYIDFKLGHSHTAYFTGTEGTTTSQSSSTTTSYGKATPDALNNMPPYICKYCWERTA